MLDYDDQSDISDGQISDGEIQRENEIARRVAAQDGRSRSRESNVMNEN